MTFQYQEVKIKVFLFYLIEEGLSLAGQDSSKLPSSSTGCQSEGRVWNMLVPLRNNSSNADSLGARVSGSAWVSSRSTEHFKLTAV